MNISEIARELGKLGKGKPKRMSEEAVEQRRAAAKQSAIVRRQRIALGQNLTKPSGK